MATINHSGIVICYPSIERHGGWSSRDLKEQSAFTREGKNAFALRL